MQHKEVEHRCRARASPSRARLRQGCPASRLRYRDFRRWGA